MLFRPTSPLILRIVLSVFALLCVAARPAGKAKGGDDSLPELVSTTGGDGGGWANVDELKKAAEGGNAKAQAQFGELLLRGDQVKQDVPRALTMLEQAANQNDANAAFRLGKIYDDGDPMPKDYAKALHYYHIAASAGVAEAQYNLGAMYVSARGVKRDYAEGLAWLRVAAKNGADPTGEQQVRMRLEQSKRTRLIQQGEQRAEEIARAIAAGERLALRTNISAASSPNGSAPPSSITAPSPAPAAGPNAKVPVDKPAVELPKPVITPPPAINVPLPRPEAKAEPAGDPK